MFRLFKLPYLEVGKCILLILIISGHDVQYINLRQCHYINDEAPSHLFRHFLCRVRPLISLFRAHLILSPECNANYPKVCLNAKLNNTQLTE